MDNVLKIVEPYAIATEQRAHGELLKAFGERCILRRVWQLADLEAGRTTRCPHGHAGATMEDQALVASVYKGTGDAYCGTCYGTGFLGGFDPVIYVTWALVNDADQNWERSRTGDMPPETPRAQFMWEPELDEGDLLVRVRTWADEAQTIPAEEVGRWVMEEIGRVTIRTGPQTPGADILVAQVCQIDNLPQEHPYLDVPVGPRNIAQTITNKVGATDRVIH